MQAQAVDREPHARRVLGQCARHAHLLERAREAQAVRIAANPSSDVSTLDMSDIRAATGDR